MNKDETSNLPEVVDTEVNGIADTKPEVQLDATLFEESVSEVPLLHAAQVSDVGAIRKRNEDSCLVFSSESGGHFPLMTFGLYIVADGMGGHESGHLASKGASRAAANHILKEVYLPLLSNDAPPDQAAVQRIMEDAVQIAHKAIYNPDPEKDGGTTLTVALILGQDLHVAHVGDSRAYCLVDGTLEAVSVDHSLVQRMQDEGQLTAEEAQHYQYRNVLLRALGQENRLEVDTYQLALPRAGKLLLCSDGLCGYVIDPELQDIMNQPVSPHIIAKQLIAAAMAAGGYDNITAVVVDFSY